MKRIFSPAKFHIQESDKHLGVALRQQWRGGQFKGRLFTAEDNNGGFRKCDIQIRF
jgi:hypothetical protein